MSTSGIPPPFCPIYARNKIFASDLVYFIAREYRTIWIPSNRLVDPLSPMTSDIENGVRAILRNRDQILLQKYELLVPPGTPAHVGIFYGHAVQTFHVFFNTCGNPQGFFRAMVDVARMGILFYERGVFEAPGQAVLLIAENLWRYMQLVGPHLPAVFPAFQEICREIAQQP